MVGRDQTVQEISEQLKTERFVTIVGPGGIGKTTVAVSVGYELLTEFAGAIQFLDLGPLNDPLLIPGTVASALGLPVQSADPTRGLIGFLRGKRMLLILDSCEHVIETAAALAERIFEEAPQVHILATSRESLRVEGEHVHRLSPLGSPPDDAGLTAAQALDFPAVQLFVERAIASGRRFELNDADAPVVAEICRRLDGIALAIELAAGRADAYGIQETLLLLNDRFKLLWEGRRTALPRHQTLRATLDWSYDLLSEHERLVLRRLSVFTGIFTLDAARSVAADDDVDGAQIVASVVSLVTKSLIAVSAGDTTTRYRLLDTTRAYAAGKLVESGEADAIKRRHAIYYRELFERTETDLLVSTNDSNLRSELLGNARVALEWSFSSRDDVGIGTSLAAVAAPFLSELSLLTECHRLTGRALAALGDADRGTRREMELQASLGSSLIHGVGLGLKGALAIHYGEAEAGVQLLRHAIDTLRADRYELHNPTFLGILAEGLAKTGQRDAALIAVDDAITRVESNGKAVGLPELLRIKATILMSAPQADLPRAEELLQGSLELAGRQHALAWELRTVTSFARSCGRCRAVIRRRGTCWRRYLIGTRKASRVPI